MSMRERMAERVSQTQDEITQALERWEPQGFREDRWERPGGGGGRSRVIQDGAVFEKAGVNVSVVHGTLSDDAARSMRARGIDTTARDFYATGVSLVIHPHNPMCPTVHCNYRYFELGGGAHWWFGGGADLTPSILFEDDARHFHATLKAACDATDQSYYPRFKTWCDDYFFIRHRDEARGVGGIFFDDLADRDPDELFRFSTACQQAFLPSYLPILERRCQMEHRPEHKRWQGLRRGRYVEFNLVYDRGTLFGLRTNARIESVLMSLPLNARWEYDHQPQAFEAEMTQVLKRPRDWID